MFITIFPLKRRKVTTFISYVQIFLVKTAIFLAHSIKLSHLCRRFFFFLSTFDYFFCIYKKKVLLLRRFLKSRDIITMSSVNKVILIGNVGSDPEVRYLDRGVAIANFNLATTERGYTMQNGTQVPDKTDWHAIVLWRNLAEWAERFVRKGMKLYVEGKLQTRTWEKEGQIRRKTEVIAENVQILYRPEEYRNLGREENRDESPVQPAEPAPATPDFDENIF